MLQQPRPHRPRSSGAWFAHPGEDQFARGLV